MVMAYARGIETAVRSQFLRRQPRSVRSLGAVRNCAARRRRRARPPSSAADRPPAPRRAWEPRRRDPTARGGCRWADADGLSEVLTHEDNALIVPRRDPRALADGLIRLIDNPAERSRLAAAARRDADDYDITTFTRKMERLYDVLVRESRPRHRDVAGLPDLAFLTHKARV